MLLGISLVDTASFPTPDHPNDPLTLHADEAERDKLAGLLTSNLFVRFLLDMGTVYVNVSFGGAREMSSGTASELITVKATQQDPSIFLEARGNG